MNGYAKFIKQIYKIYVSYLKFRERKASKVAVRNFLKCSYLNLRFTFACLDFGRQVFTLLNR
ncbi:MAG: hypothetical protein LBP59_20315 [Planctomycetaceae bacterium]|nr:hypothetical protein [Planctomycetaceae bacterium]